MASKRYWIVQADLGHAVMVMELRTTAEAGLAVITDIANDAAYPSDIQRLKLHQVDKERFDRIRFPEVRKK